MFTQTIAQFTANMDGIRDFVDTLDVYLAEQVTQTLRDNTIELAPLFLAMQKLELSMKVAEGTIAEAPLPLNDSSLPSSTKKENPGRHKLDEEDILSRVNSRFSINLNYEISEKEEQPSCSFTITGKDATIFHPVFRNAIRAMHKSMNRLDLLYKSSLMNLTSTVELLYSQILHIYFSTHPGVIGTKEKIFSFDDLAEHGSIEEARQHYINAKIEEILHRSFGDWNEYLKTTAKLTMSYLDADIEELKETFQRRNLVVHNGGQVNSIYISKVPAELRKGISVGHTLQISKDYLHSRIDMFERNCTLVVAELWKRIDSEDRERASILLDTAYQHLLNARWSIAKSYSYFLMGDKQMDEFYRLAAQLNYLLCLKRLGKTDTFKSEIKDLNFSAKNLKLQMGLAALQQNLDEFYQLVPKALATNELSLEDLNIYPI